MSAKGNVGALQHEKRQQGTFKRRCCLKFQQKNIGRRAAQQENIDAS